MSGNGSLTARELEEARADFEALLVDTCTVERRTVSTDEYGAPSETWTVVADNVPCRVMLARREFPRAEAGTVGAQEAMPEVYRLSVPWGTGLQPEDRITVGGAVYRITKLMTAATETLLEQAMIARAR